MPYKLLYHHKVKQDDLPSIDSSIKKRIFATIESRLTIEPQRYGKPLRKPLSRYWKLRIGDYRVVYKIVKKEVWILAIFHRQKIYPFVTKRLEEEKKGKKKIKRSE